MGNIIDTNFQTPEIVADYMACFIPHRCETVLEPTPGLGNLVRAAEKRGYIVTAPQLFEDIPAHSRFDCVLMNPPFTPMIRGYEFLCAVMPMSDNIVCLMPWFTLINSNKRLNAIEEFGLEYIIHLPGKTFPACRVQCCIVVLNNGYTGPTIFDSFNW